ncbi:hypothetical protein G6F36_008292 [Rhizopus arrhizus]|nr:hypothetical protein G6F36_008292 [Rhizopus arrhizus]
MKPLIKLPSLQRSGLDRLSSKTMMLETMPQKPLNYQPACNTRESSLKRIEQKTPLTKDLWQTSTKQDSNNVYSTTTPTTISNMDVLMEEEDIGEQTEVTPNLSQDLSVGIFTREGTDVGTASPLQSTIPTLPPTTINSNNFTVASTNITSTTTTETTTATASTYTTTSYSTELLNSSRWHPSRGPSDQFLPQLEETDTTPMAIETDKRRISDSVYINSKAMLFTKKICSSRRTKGNKYCNKQISNCRNNRKVYRPNSKRLPFKIFHPSRSNQEETHSGLSQNKPIYSGGTFQDGRGTSSERPHRTKRFHGKTRLTRRIHRITNPSKFKALLSIRKPRHNLPVQSSQLWTKCRSKDFFQNTSEYLVFEFNTKKMQIKVPELKIQKLMQRIKQAMTPTIRTCR